MECHVFVFVRPLFRCSMLLITALSDISSHDVKYHVNVLEMFEACWAFVGTLWYVSCVVGLLQNFVLYLT